VHCSAWLAVGPCGQVIRDRPTDIRDRVKQLVVKIYHMKADSDELQPVVKGNGYTDFLTIENDSLLLHRTLQPETRIKLANWNEIFTTRYVCDRRFASN
jgi:hypothetical protein